MGTKMQFVKPIHDVDDRAAAAGSFGRASEADMAIPDLTPKVFFHDS